MDAADIAIFGRMVANDSSVGVEAAGMFSHALSTHAVADYFDFFSAVDESKPANVAFGAAITDTLAYTSATYYRYAALNLSWLTEDPKKNLCSLAKLTKEQRQKVVRTFLQATLEAVPSARKNSMNAHNPPAYALGLYREAGQPIQLVNAFEKPVWSKNGYLQPSIREMLIHYNRMKEVFGVKAEPELATGFEKVEPDDGDKKVLTAEMIPDHVNITKFCERLSSHAD
jgi:CRISPR system Cascade subunit CasC